MNTSNIANILRGDIALVKVVFPSATGEYASKEYTYRTTKEQAHSMRVGDLLVVPARGEFKLVKLTSIDTSPILTEDTSHPYRWIVQKVDFSDYYRQHEIDEDVQKTIEEARTTALRQQLSDTLGVSLEKLTFQITKKLENSREPISQKS